MKLLALGFLLLPLCAVVAGLGVWAINRKSPMDDGELMRGFLVILAISLSLAVAISRTDAVRLRLDPQFKLQTELDAHPVYSTIKRLAPDDYKKLQAFLAVQLSQGAKLAEAFIRARPLLTAMATHRVGFADQKTRLTWAFVTVEALKELQAQDAMLCYRALPPKSLDQQPPALAFSADNTKAFQQVIVELYESADRGMRRDRPPGDIPVEFNDAAREYRAIKETVAQRFGEPVSKLLATKAFPDPPVEAPEKVCAAMIFQLEAMQARPQAMASSLLGSVLR